MDYNGLFERIKCINVCKALSLLLGKHLVIIGIVITAIINTVDCNGCFLSHIRKSRLSLMRSFWMSGIKEGVS